MKDISFSNIKNCIAYVVVIIVMLMSGKTLHCADLQKEIARQAKITAFLTAHQNKPKQKTREESEHPLLEDSLRERTGTRQRKRNKGYIRRQALDVYAEEAEQKGDVIPLPIGSLARASEQQRRNNKAYTRELQRVLQAAQIPQAQIDIVKDYARPEWVLRNKLHHHSDRIYNVWSIDTMAISYSDSATKKEGAVWYRNTGTLDNVIPNATRYKDQPEQELDLLERMGDGFTDFANSPNGQMVALTTFNGGSLYVLPSGLSFGQAMAEGRLRFIKNHKANEAISDEQLQQNPFMSVAFSPCSNYIFAGGADGTMHQIDANTGTSIYSFDHNAAVTAITTVPDGTIYAGLNNGQVAIWHGEFVPPSTTSQLDNASDGSQTASMEDEALQTCQLPPASGTDRMGMHAMLLSEDCIRCVKHGMQCCTICAELGKVSAACCRTGVSCAKHCPAAAAFCCYKSSLMAQNTCRVLCGRLVGAMRRLWQ